VSWHHVGGHAYKVNMIDELKSAIEGLYETFSIYPFKSTMDGCPCCVSNSDKEKIHSKQLRQLDGEDLSRYAFKAIDCFGMTTAFTAVNLFTKQQLLKV
jgi:hypothetical protein